MGKILMIIAFFIALLVMGQMIVESDGSNPSGFSLSTLFIIVSIILYVIGEILHSKEVKNV